MSGLGIVPAALLLHNLEEALTIRGALPQMQAQVSSGLGHPVRLPSAEQYWLALGLLTLAGLGLFLLAWWRDSAAYALVVLQAVMALNVVTHVIGSVLLGGYAPGLVTALLVEAPASAVVYRRLQRAGWMTRHQWTLLPGFAVLLHGPGLLGLLAVARRL